MLLLERRDQLGGAAISERPLAGVDARLSRYAYLVALFPERIARDLRIELVLRDRPVAAHATAARGELPERPPAELYCHSLTDPSIVAGVRHTLTLFGLHTPRGCSRTTRRTGGDIFHGALSWPW